MKERTQPLLLFIPHKGHKFLGYFSVFSAAVAPTESGESRECAQRERLRGDSAGEPYQFKPRRSAEGMSCQTFPDPERDEAIRTSSGTLMKHSELRKSLHAPAVHSSHHFTMPVRTSVFQGGVPSDGFKALTAEHLNGVGYRANAVGLATLELTPLLLTNESTGEAQQGILVELSE